MNAKRIFALSVGIGSYSLLPHLICPPRDAADFAAVLNSGISCPEIRVLINANATKASILRELGWLANSAGRGDTAILFFSGHGGRELSGSQSEACLCPFEASLPDLKETCLSSTELSNSLRSIKSERLIVMLDTCYSGGIGEPRRRGVGMPNGLTSRDVEGLIEGTGRVILAASRPDEPAWELNGMRNGLFTNYVLRALRGDVARPDGSIWASDLFSYVSRGVRQHRCQRPYQKAVGEDFVVLVQKEVERQLRLPKPAPSEDDQRPLRLAMRHVYDRDELSLLCRDLGLSLDDLPGRTLETQLMDLIDYCHRHGLYSQLLQRLRTDRPHLALVS